MNRVFLSYLFILLFFGLTFFVVRADNNIITTTHRFQAGVAYGGWGPHLGHLMRATDGTLWFADDTGNDAKKNPAINYYKFSNGIWSLAGSNPLFGTVQQNTGSVLLSNDLIFSYGIDTLNNRIEECYFSIKVNYKGCNHLPFVLDTQANYIGVALAPNGTKLLWWTDIRDNSAGNFNYIYDFGTGWNGPVSAVLPGFSGVSYINVAFKDSNSFTMLGQLDSGLAPNWTFTAAVADGVIGQQLVWNTLAGSGSDLPITGQDIWIDPISKNSHLLARSGTGTTFYYHRSSGGSWSGVLFSIPSSYRARFVSSSNGKLYVVYGQSGSGLKYYEITKSPLVGAINFTTLTPNQVDLSSDFGNIDAIYPESSIYQQAPVKDLNFAVNGSMKQGEITHVSIPTTVTPASTPTPSPVTPPPPSPTPVTVVYPSPETPSLLVPFEFLRLKFDDSLTDSSSKSNSGSSANPPSFIDGKYGKAASFNGSTNFVQISDNDSLEPTEISLSAWIKVDALPPAGSYTYLFGKPHSASWQSYALQLNSSGNLMFTVQNADLNQYPKWETKASLTPGIWYHVGAVYKRKGNNASDGVIYINGNQTETTFGGIPTTSSFNIKYDNTGFDIGRFSPANQRYYKGAIDDVRVYSKAIGACEMQTISGVTQ
jgi:hypothetical protein